MTPWDAIKRINGSDWPPCVKNLARALLQWRNARTGELRPSLATIAAALGTSESTARAYVGSAIKCGALVIVGTRSGGRASTRYRLVLPDSDATNPPESGGFNGSIGHVNPPETGGQPTELRPPARWIPSLNPPDSGPEPSMDRPKDQPPTPAAADVVSQLGIEDLRGHANATPERLSWIARVAPGKGSPGGWAAKCIREGWDVPAPTEADAKAASKAAREATLARFDAMPKAERTEVLALARRLCPNLADARAHPDDSPGVRGAVARVLAAREGRAAPAGGAA